MKKKNKKLTVYSTNPNFEYNEENDENLPINPEDQLLEVWIDKHRAGKTAVIIKGFIGDLSELKTLSKRNENIILAGDFNILPSAEDAYNIKGFEDDALYRLEIRKKFREMINLGFNDVYRHFYEDKEGYTFWDYMRGAWQKNNGMRIDHFLVSNSIIDQIKDININKDPRGREKPSDHTPIEINLA